PEERVKQFGPHPEERPPKSGLPDFGSLKCRNRQQPISMGGRPEALEGRRMATGTVGLSFETRCKDSALLRMRFEYFGCTAIESTYQGVIIMRMKHVLLSTVASLAMAFAASGIGAVKAQAAPGLSGQVTGPEGPMEGILVTAKKNGSTIA